ncbi:MAG: aspartate aminotransferase family protein [Acidianus hospitalis]
MENLDGSILDAPKIKVTPPGPKSREILKIQEEMETSALNYPKYFNIAIKEARGSTIIDVDDNVYIDWFAGVAVVNLGHRNPEIVKALKEQIEKFWHYMEIPSEIRVDFLKEIRETFNFDSKILFTTTGADAVEASVKIARWNTGKRFILSFDNAYHGITAGTLGFTTLPSAKKFQPYYDNNVISVPYPYEYRCPFKDCLNEVLSLVEYEVKTHEVAGILVEPVQGEGGYIVPPKGFLKGLREIADKYNSLLIVDEIQSGVGRTGKMWAYEWEGIVPDIVTVAKGIGEGIPISLVAYRKDLDKLPQAFHLGTYRGNPIGLAVGKATIDYIKKYDILNRVVSLGEYAKRKFSEIMEDNYRGSFDVRGLGFMIGIEFSDEKKNPMSEFVTKMIRNMLKEGVIMYKAGIYNNVLRFMAPLTIPRELLSRGLEIFEKALNI